MRNSKKMGAICIQVLQIPANSQNQMTFPVLGVRQTTTTTTTITTTTKPFSPKQVGVG